MNARGKLPFHRQKFDGSCAGLWRGRCHKLRSLRCELELVDDHLDILPVLWCQSFEQPQVDVYWHWLLRNVLRGLLGTVNPGFDLLAVIITVALYRSEFHLVAVPDESVRRLITRQG